MKINIKKLDPNAKLPSYAHPGDAGMDFFSLEKLILKPHEVSRIKTGVAIEIPEGYAGLIWDKSGLSINHKLKLLGGVIDAGYRGEIIMGMINLGDTEYVLEAGHKIGQMLIQKVEFVDIKEVEELSGTKRGEGGFGSTGK